MKDTLIVRGAPQEYICEVGSWDNLESHIIRREIKRVLILHGEKSWQVAQPFFPEFKEVTCFFEHYKNECSYQNAAYFETFVKENQIEGIIGIGGGKVLDLAKLVANHLLLDVFCLPTLASTCAPYTPISIVYNERGEMIDLLFLDQSITLTLIDPMVILDSPKEFLIAGIGDTLAKWYESDPIISNIQDPSVEIMVARFAAKSCQENLLNFGSQAIEDLENKKLSSALVKVIETNIMLAGMVGGFGDKYGRTSGAHAIHDSITVIPASHNHLHGNKVAYGIMVQLAMEEKWEEIQRMLPFYQSLNLPFKHAHLGVTEEEMEQVATLAAEDEYIHLLPFDVTAAKLINAVKTLEAL